jgi:hypothetical protein
MKYIITEDKVRDIILNYIENKYPIDEINYTEGHDNDGNPDDSSYVFYYGDYDDGGNNIFGWYGRNYFLNGMDNPTTRIRISLSPILYFEDSREIDNLNNLFGNKWEPVFIEWFYRNFSLRVKTVV